MGKWLTTIVVDGKSAGTSSGVVKEDLPISNFLSKVIVTFSVSGTSPTVTISKAEIIANGSITLKSLSGAEARILSTYRDGVAPNGSEGSSSVTEILNFGRFNGDTLCILPAKAFKTLVLSLTYTFGGTVTSSSYTVETVEWVADEDVKSKIILKETEIETKASGTGNADVKLPLGNKYRQIWLNGTIANMGQISLRLNNASEIPVTINATTLNYENQRHAQLASALSTDVCIDLDWTETLTDLLDSYQYNDVVVRATRPTNATAVTVYAQEAIPLA